MNSNTLEKSISIGIQVVSFCAYFVLYYILIKLSIILLRALWKISDDIVGIRKRVKPSAKEVILITGGTSGIGLALAKYFYKKGFSIIVTRHSKREPDELVELKKSSELSQDTDKPKIFFIHLDVQSQESIENSYNEVKTILSSNKLNLYALINNAGISIGFKCVWATRNQIKAINSTNFLGPVLMIRQYMPLLMGTPNSRIIQVGSGLSLLAGNGYSIYSGTKAGMCQFMNSLGHELEQYNVQTVTVHVGNLIQNTSILDNCMKNLDEVYREFSKDDLEVFDQDVRNCVEKQASFKMWLESKGKGAKNHLNLNIVEITINKIINILGGKLSSCTEELENSFFAMRSFDRAVCLVENPNNELFSGNWFYDYFSSSFFETLDSVERRIMSSLLHSNLPDALLS